MSVDKKNDMRAHGTQETKTKAMCLYKTKTQAHGQENKTHNKSVINNFRMICVPNSMHFICNDRPIFHFSQFISMQHFDCTTLLGLHIMTTHFHNFLGQKRA